MKQKAFTLIEMLIVIVIIGILASALVPRLISIQARARDTKRKVDFKSIYNAILVYKNDYSVYPNAWTCAVNTTCYVDSTSWASWVPQLSWILPTLPLDPLNNYIWNHVLVATAYNYMYGSVFRNGKVFALFTRLENKADPDRCEFKDYNFYNWFFDTVFWCQVDTACTLWPGNWCIHSCYWWVNCKDEYIISDLWL